MSYTILYNTMFLRSGEGITPCVLSGSNNCYDASNRRRDRSWSIFLNQLGTTEKEMLAAIEPWLGGYQEHWMRGGKWVDDAGLIRWVKNNSHNSYLLEDVLAENHLRSVNCYISVWGTGYSHRREAEAICSTTQELDAWIHLSQKVIADRKAAGEQVFPVIDFPRENIRRPRKCMLPDASKVLLKHGNSYLQDCQKDSVSWTRSIKDARVFTREEADVILDTCSVFSSIRKSRVIDAARKELPYNAVIRIKSGPPRRDIRCTAGSRPHSAGKQYPRCIPLCRRENSHCSHEENPAGVSFVRAGSGFRRLNFFHVAHSHARFTAWDP